MKISLSIPESTSLLIMTDKYQSTPSPLLKGRRNDGGRILKFGSFFTLHYDMFFRASWESKQDLYAETWTGSCDGNTTLKV
jgi:hypothetical protein